MNTTPAAVAITTLRAYLAAILRAQAPLTATTGWIDGVGMITRGEFQQACHAARGAYLAGRRHAAIDAMLLSLYPAYDTYQPTTRTVLRAEAGRVLRYLESHAA